MIRSIDHFYWRCLPTKLTKSQFSLLYGWTYCWMMCTPRRITKCRILGSRHAAGTFDDHCTESVYLSSRTRHLSVLWLHLRWPSFLVLRLIDRWLPATAAPRVSRPIVGEWKHQRLQRRQQRLFQWRQPGQPAGAAAPDGPPAARWGLDRPAVSHGGCVVVACWDKCLSFLFSLW